MATLAPRGWHSRGYLPHFDADAAIQAVTFRLSDTLPHEVVAQWKLELMAQQATAGQIAPDHELRRRIERYLDVGRGECWLRRPDVAQVVQDALLHFDGERYRLLAWTIMPNHVHLIVQALGWPLERLVHSWKSFTANQINRLLERTGAVWFPDYFDRFIRDEAHLASAVEYVHQNPVKAGLVARACDWPFSSASR